MPPRAGWMSSARRFPARCPRWVAPPPARAGWVAAAVVAFGALGGAEAAGQMTIGVHPTKPFPAHLPRPIKIDIGFYLIDFARISGREETFDIQGYLTASYTDPSLALPDGERGGGEERRFPTDAIWTPNFEFGNAVEQVKVQNEAALVVDDHGRVKQRFRFVGKFTSPMDLRRFPFDSQTLTVYVEPFERQTKDVQFVVNREHVGRPASVFVTDWVVHDVAAKVVDVEYPAFGRTASRLVFEIPVSRKSTFYLWRVLLPITLLVATSWVIYWFEPSNLQPLISTTVAILLNVILFNFTIDFALPKVAYLTFVDSYALTCLCFLLANMVAVTAVHVTFLRLGPEAARGLQSKALRSLPLAFLAATSAEAWYFLFA